MTSLDNINAILRNAGYNPVNSESVHTVQSQENVEHEETIEEEVDAVTSESSETSERGVHRTSPQIVQEYTQEAESENQESQETQEPEEQEEPVKVIRQELERFSSALWFEKMQEQIIILAGVGGIGSWSSLLLAKMNPKELYLYDMDKVEVQNLAGQLYSKDDVGEFKVNALANTIRKFTGYGNIFAIPQRYTISDECISGKVMICGFDNMSAREVFFQKWESRVNSLSDEEKKECLFIDGRLTADELQVFCIRGNATPLIEKYKSKYLFPQYMAQSLPCSFRQTGYMANMIGGIIANLVVNFCANLCNPQMKRTLPFVTKYTSDFMLLSKDF